MSDILISLRPTHKEDIIRAETQMKYYDSIQVSKINFKNISIAVSRADDINLWGAYENENTGVFVALNGRIALDPLDWSKIERDERSGGLACRHIYNMYASTGKQCIERLNGNFTAIIYDYTKDLLIVGTDRCGSVPCFKTESNANNIIIGSHPDIVATIAGFSDDLDLISCSEFISTGKLTPPHTYYKNIKFLNSGALHSFRGNSNSGFEYKVYKYFEFKYSFDHGLKKQELVEYLASAFKKAINRRVLPMFGKTGISLSAGLDSRTILCSAQGNKKLKAFCFFDTENNEFKIAKKIAETTGTEFIPLRRDFEHYGNAAIKGIQISGGMGDLGSNHYLGFRNVLNEKGINNIITGFYCDYLFKGLPYNRKGNILTRRMKFAPFSYSWYMPVYWLQSKYNPEVQNRLGCLFPQSVTNSKNDSGRSLIEKNRVFPLCYEPDNLETIIPQRTMGWYLPIVDNDIVDVYLKIPPSWKINIDFYSKVTAAICGKSISKIVNGNTGVRVDATPLEIMFSSNLQALRRKMVKIKQSIESFDSWPNWEYYLLNNRTVNHIWNSRTEISNEFIREITGENIFELTPSDFIKQSKIKLYLRLISMKIWLESRIK